MPETPEPPQNPPELAEEGSVTAMKPVSDEVSTDSRETPVSPGEPIRPVDEIVAPDTMEIGPNGEILTTLPTTIEGIAKLADEGRPRDIKSERRVAGIVANQRLKEGKTTDPS